jgi:4-amino-4-deoxy-L-arabinose transferase-like glycosyltransferase
LPPASRATLLPNVVVPLLVLLAVAIAARVGTFANPVIGFDEQFYLLVGDRMWHGMLPFVDIFDRKPVGLFLIYAAARGLGGDGFLQYKLVALVSVVATAFVLYRMARRGAAPFGAIAAALLYILWLDFMEGEGGQAPIFYNLPMITAAAATVHALRHPAVRRRSGGIAMLLVGIALQIKYSVVIEGVYFGCALIVLAWRSGDRGAALLGSVVIWVACALLPTALAFGYYAAIGHAQDFLFCNFLSLFGQGRSANAVQLAGLAAIVGILLPLVLFLAIGWRGRERRDPAADQRGFLLGWLATATIGMVVYWRFVSPHYAMPLLLPLCLLLAPGLGVGRWRRIATLVLIAVAFVGGQIVMVQSTARKGGGAAARAVAAAAHSDGRCIYVYDGYPGLYMLAHSCLPSRWAFPGHLNMADESRAVALGVAPTDEVRRILATRPPAIVDDYPRFEFGNVATHAILAQVLARDYVLAACVPTGPVRVRLIYRLRSEAIAYHPAHCPSAMALSRGQPG